MTEYWADNVGNGTKAGTSYANRAVVDPSDGDNIWAILDTFIALGLADDLTIYLCGDSSITASIVINRDATATYRVLVQGRNAGDTADAEVDIDAGGGAFKVLNCATADFWDLWNIHFTNTDKQAGNDGLFLSANADNVTVYECRASKCSNGFTTSSSDSSVLVRCRAHDNAAFGISMIAKIIAIDCVSHDNGSYGISNGSHIRCTSYGNTLDGFINSQGAVGCTSYGNGSDGFHSSDSVSAHLPLVDCIAEGNGAYGFFNAAATSASLLLRCADHGNTSGRKNTATGHWWDIGDPGVTSDPFVDAANGNFALNGSPGGLACQNHAGILLPGGLSRSFQSVGAIQTPLSAKHISRRLARLYMSMRS